MTRENEPGVEEDHGSGPSLEDSLRRHNPASGHNRKPEKISVIIPCYNEESRIEACLHSVAWADEILVVDSFSTDRTLDIVRQFTDRILQDEYHYSSAQKNWAIPQAEHEWILLLDSDERVTPALEQEIKTLLQSGPKNDGYWIYRNTYLFGEKIHYSGWGRDSVLRLFRKSVARYEDKRVHAEIQLSQFGVLKARLDHFSILTISGWIEKIDRYSSWKAQDKFERGMRVPVLQLAARPLLRFGKDFFIRRGFCDGWRGFLIASMAAYAELIMSAKLIELRIGKKL
ncbi:MAG: glycosyltransferase family 2 protein [Desulfohalobiaceae bacterium]|nr:glycosyltransferase family 2 protein [Desulfohalobiaceae bacterium]